MKIGLIVVAVLLLVGMGACSKFVGVRNDLVTQREAVNAAWSTIDVALQRRSDLIPNLVETVKGFAAHETEVFKNIADARAAMAGARNPAEKIAANDQLSGALSRLLVPGSGHARAAGEDRAASEIVAKTGGTTRR